MPISLPRALHRMAGRAFATAACGLAFVVASPAAHAVFIDFDDIPRLPYPGIGDPFSFDYHPLTNEYRSKGLVIEDGYLNEYWSGYQYAVSGPNYLLGGPPLQLHFVGTLPTFVSMYVSAAIKDMLTLAFSGPSGFLGYVFTAGDSYPDNPDQRPYEPNQFVSFQAASGISYITIGGYFNRPADAMIDNLTYLYAPTAVPEPSSAALLALGLLGIAWRVGERRKSRSTKEPGSA